MPATPLFHPGSMTSATHGRLGRLTKREAASLASLKQLARKQGLSLGLVRGPGEQNDVCLLRFLRSQGFEEKRVSGVECNTHTVHVCVLMCLFVCVCACVWVRLSAWAGNAISLRLSVWSGTTYYCATAVVCSSKYDNSVLL